MSGSKITLVAGVCLLAGVASAQAPGDIRIEVAHGDNTDFSLTPVWFGFHNGLFDAFDVGDDLTSASDLADDQTSPSNGATNAVELIAELGDVSQITADFSAAPGVPGDIQGVAAAAGNGVPPIEPGETGVGFVTPINPSAYQYFSFLSMLVPTNDTFIGNDDPFAYQVFNDDDELIDALGNPTSSRTITILGSDILDAGTEVNSGVGAAFTQGQVGTDGAVEGGVVTLGSDLSAFLGATDVTGRLITDDILAGEVLATITISIVPEPASAALFAIGLIGVAAGRRR